MTKLSFDNLSEIVLDGVRISRADGKFSFRDHTFRDHDGSDWTVPTLIAHGGPSPVVVEIPNKTAGFGVAKSCQTPGIPKCYGFYDDGRLRNDHSHLVISDPTVFHNAGIITHDYLPHLVRLELTVERDGESEIDNDGIVGNIGWL